AAAPAAAATPVVAAAPTAAEPVTEPVPVASAGTVEEKPVTIPAEPALTAGEPAKTDPVTEPVPAAKADEPAKADSAKAEPSEPVTDALPILTAEPVVPAKAEPEEPVTEALPILTPEGVAAAAPAKADSAKADPAEPEEPVTEAIPILTPDAEPAKSAEPAATTAEPVEPARPSAAGSDKPTVTAAVPAEPGGPVEEKPITIPAEPALTADEPTPAKATAEPTVTPADEPTATPAKATDDPTVTPADEPTATPAKAAADEPTAAPAKAADAPADPVAPAAQAPQTAPEVPQPAAGDSGNVLYRKPKAEDEEEDEGPSRNWGRLIAIVAVAIILIAGIVYAFTAFGGSDPKDAAAGDCVSLSAASLEESEKVQTVGCDDDKALLLVGKVIGNDTDSCPEASFYQQYPVEGKPAQGFRLCLLPNLAEGSCYKLDDLSANYVKTECKGVEALKVTKVIKDTDDTGQCPDGAGESYPEPKLTYCFAPAEN
ncbi:hypothetical protein ACFFQW_36200, partial [Umezawaea endophytica]|uniref:LppU/SCO3897 family protein n=1 Tax=Umezawaea endophytica TaxID=1654476 RepID=UPI0035E804DE